MTDTVHTFLVAFQVAGEPSRAVAEIALLAGLPRPGRLLPSGPELESWWVAEDDRQDGSDNDSAVFVYPGAQQAAFDALQDAAYDPARPRVLTGDVNDPRRMPDRRPSNFEPPVPGVPRPE